MVGRIVVPELRGGQTVWMIGRSLDEPSASPKYLALGGERPVLGFERAVGRKEAILCEGVFDYLTAVNWGLPATGWRRDVSARTISTCANCVR